jgi:hypothetical protein
MYIFVFWGPSLWSSGQSSWLLIQGSGFDSQCYQIFWEVVGLKLGPLSLVSTIQELLGRKSNSFGLESWEYGRRDLSCWPNGTLYLQKLLLTSPTSGGCSVGIVRSQTQAASASWILILLYILKLKMVWKFGLCYTGLWCNSLFLYSVT